MEAYLYLLGLLEGLNSSVVESKGNANRTKVNHSLIQEQSVEVDLRLELKLAV